MSFEPLTRDDVDDEKLVAGQLRALQREVRDGFELVTGKLLTAMERMERKLDDQASRISDLERWQSQADSRLAALEKRGRKATRFR